MLDGISWGVLPLVAGLFVLVEALDKTGLIRALGDMLRSAAEQSETQIGWEAGLLIAFVWRSRMESISGAWLYPIILVAGPCRPGVPQ